MIMWFIISLSNHLFFFPSLSLVVALDKKWSTLPSNIKTVYSGADGTRKKLGELIKRPVLAKTLEYIANFGSDAFYKDTYISRSIVDTVRANKGIMTAEDLLNYKVRMEEPFQATFNGEFVEPLSKSK